MSVEWLKWAWEQRIGDSGAKFVLVTLCNWANSVNPDDKQLVAIVPEHLRTHIGSLGWAWPSQDLLAARCDMGERTVRRHICTLEEQDRILSFERRRPDGRKSSTGYLLITSPAKLAAGTSPANLAKTSPANLAATYEDTQGLIQKEGVITPASHSVNKTPLPPFRVSDHLTAIDWQAVERELFCKDGAKLSATYFTTMYDAWVPKLPAAQQPRNVAKHFLAFIQSHKRRNKL